MHSYGVCGPNLPPTTIEGLVLLREEKEGLAVVVDQIKSQEGEEEAEE